jgi:hypothetical protein
MNARIKSALCLGAAITLFVLPAANAQSNAAPIDIEPQRQTIRDIRSVGTAMFAWYKDEMAPKRSEEAHKKAEVEPKSADVSAVPVISREELTKILAPKYIASVPEKDGWGHPYEFHLNTTDPNAAQVMGLRSAGRDGKFSADVYVIGSFTPQDVDQDILWMDGYFVRWPQANPNP